MNEEGGKGPQLPDGFVCCVLFVCLFCFLFVFYLVLFFVICRQMKVGLQTFNSTEEFSFLCLPFPCHQFQFRIFFYFCIMLFCCVMQKVYILSEHFPSTTLFAKIRVKLGFCRDKEMLMILKGNLCTNDRKITMTGKKKEKQPSRGRLRCT